MMTHHAADDSPATVRMIKAGAALTGGGLLVASVGMGLAAVALARTAMTWSRQHDAAALLAARLNRAKEASIAGFHAWQDTGGSAVDGHHSRAR